jgi:hypothetical protein
MRKQKQVRIVSVLATGATGPTPRENQYLEKLPDLGVGFQTYEGTCGLSMVEFAGCLLNGSIGRWSRGAPPGRPRSRSPRCFQRLAGHGLLLT